MTTLIMYILLVPVLPILYALMRNEATPKKNILLGVTLPYEARGSEEVAVLQKGYKKALGWCTLGLLLLSAGCFLFSRFSLMMTWLMYWMLLAILVPQLVYIRYHKRLKALKQTHSWQSPAAGRRVVDLKVAAQTKPPLRPAWFIPPAVLAVVPVVATLVQGAGDEGGIAMLALYGINALLLALFYGFYRLIGRQRAEVVDDNSALTENLTRVRRRYWSQSWLALAWATAAFNFGYWLADSLFWQMVLLVLYTFGILAVVIWAEMATRRAQAALTRDGEAYVDDDEHWVLGMFYYNPQDKHLMINDRTGMGMGTNFARPAGKVLIVVIVLALLTLVLIGPWLISLEFTPIRLEVGPRALVASHTGPECTVAYEDITGYERLDALPALSRVVGNSMEEQATGIYRAEGYGSCRLCLNPKAGPWLVVKTEEQTYILGSARPEETLAALEKLEALGVPAFIPGS